MATGDGAFAGFTGPEAAGVVVPGVAANGLAGCAATVDGTGAGWRLHDVQASSTDEVVKGSTVAADAVTVPGRTTAVFER